MSEFAAYCTFVRNKHSKSAAWTDDLLAAAQANPELAGAAVGGLGGAATGLFSGNMLRNGLIGAGLGAGAGFGYRMMGNKPPAPAPEMMGPPKSLMTPEMAGPPKPLEMAGPPESAMNPPKSPANPLLWTNNPEPKSPLSPIDILKHTGAESVSARLRKADELDTMLKASPFKGKEQEELVKAVADLRGSAPAAQPGVMGKAVAGVGEGLIAAGEGLDSATASARNAAGKVIETGKKVVTAPGKMLEEHAARTAAEQKAKDDFRRAFQQKLGKP